MRTIEELDGCFRQFSHHLERAIPDGVEQVTLETLSSLNLLAHSAASPTKTPWHYFHVHDSGDKITLHNDHFIAWIIPEQEPQDNSTLVIIASEEAAGIHPEIAFRTTGVYNSSRTVLRILEKYIDNIEENNSVIQSLSTESES